MIRSRAGIRRRALLLGVIGIAIGSSCHHAPPERTLFTKPTGEREQENAGPTPPAHLGGPLDPAGSVTFSPRTTPGMTMAIDQLKQADLANYLNGLIYDRDPKNGEIELVTCVHAAPAGDVPCAPNEAVRLFIEPEIGAHKWRHADFDTTKFGAIIARIINYETDDRKEATFGFPAHAKVWWVVDTSPVTHQPRSRFFRRTYTAQPPFVVQVGTDYPFFDCSHVHKVHHGEAIAKYVSCSQSLTMESTPNRDDPARAASAPAGLFRQVSLTSVVPLPKRPMVMALNAAWITCDMGCCSTTQ